METLNLTLTAGRGIATATGQCPRRLIQQLLLTGVNLVRMDFIALRPVRRDQLVCQLMRMMPQSAPSCQQRWRAACMFPWNVTNVTRFPIAETLL
jgi:hypothetical protein